MVSRPPAAAQTPKTDDSRPAQKSCIKNPSVRCQQMMMMMMMSADLPGARAGRHKNVAATKANDARSPLRPWQTREQTLQLGRSIGPRKKYWFLGFLPRAPGADLKNALNNSGQTAFRYPASVAMLAQAMLAQVYGRSLYRYRCRSARVRGPPPLRGGSSPVRHYVTAFR